MTEALALRSFVDVRAFAESAQITPGRGETDWLAPRAVLPQSRPPVTFAAAAFDDAHGSVDTLPGDEVVIVLSGELAFETGAGKLSVAPGRSVALPAGRGFRWESHGPTRAIVVTYAAQSGVADAPVAIDPDAPLSPSNPPLRELLVGEVPSCRSHPDYKSADGLFSCGTWDSTPYHRVAMTYGHAELMQLLEGEVTFVDGAGRTCVARAGDIVLVEQGAECSWESRVHVKKMYVIYRPN